MNKLSNNQFSIHALSSVKLIVELDRVIKHEKNENYYKYKPKKCLRLIVLAAEPEDVPVVDIFFWR